MTPIRQSTPAAVAAAAGLAALLTGACAPAAAPTLEFVRPQPGAAYSEVVRAGNTLYLSGAVGLRPEGDLAPGGIRPETRQTLENIQAALARFGATMDDVVKCTVFLVDIAEWATMNEVYVQFFPRTRPARSAVGVAGLPFGARVEIECIAVLGDS